MNTYKPQLDQYSIQILLDLLNKAGSEGVDVVYYRIQHEDQRDLLDKLETEEYLKKENEKYWVTLNGLIVMKDQQYAKDLLERCEKIFSVLRNHYKAKPKDNIKVIDIAYTTGLTFNQTIECLGYMKQAWFWSGWSNDVQDVAVAFVKPSEKILDHKTFKEVAIELKRLRDRRHESITPITFSAKNKKIRNAEPLVHDEHLNLHPKIAEASLSLFETQHYRDAILNSFIAVFDYIRKRTGLDLDGEDLVNNVFSLNKPLLKLNKLKTISDRNEQLGFMDIFKGAYKGIRNPKAHSLIIQMNRDKAYEYLIFASLLARRVEEATLVKKQEMELKLKKPKG